MVGYSGSPGGRAWRSQEGGVSALTRRPPLCVPVMHRESPRLQENGYYSFMEGSKATPTQRICYHETPVR